MIGSYNSELFWVLQQRYFVLKERIAVFCSQLYGDSSLKVLCLPVRAGAPGAPLALVGQRPPRSSVNPDRLSHCIACDTNSCLQFYDHIYIHIYTSICIYIFIYCMYIYLYIFFAMKHF